MVPKPPSPPLHGDCDGVHLPPWKNKAKRSKRSLSEYNYIAGCLVALAQSSVVASPFAAGFIPPNINSAVERKNQSTFGSGVTEDASPSAAELIPPNFNSAVIEKQFQSSSGSGGSGDASPSAVGLIPPNFNSGDERQIQSSSGSANDASPSAAELIPHNINSGGTDDASPSAFDLIPPNLNSAVVELIPPNFKSNSAVVERQIQIQSSAQSPAPPIDSFSCSECGKVFATHQALGGHKSSHRRPSIAAADDVKPSARTSAASDSPASGLRGLHTCSKCGERFLTGQALGGHMRKHYTGVIGRQGKSNSDGSNGSSGTTSSSGRGCESNCNGDANTGAMIDLNTPPMDPEIDLELTL